MLSVLCTTRQGCEAARSRVAGSPDDASALPRSDPCAEEEVSFSGPVPAHSLLDMTSLALAMVPQASEVEAFSLPVEVSSLVVLCTLDLADRAQAVSFSLVELLPAAEVLP